MIHARDIGHQGVFVDLEAQQSSAKWAEDMLASLLSFPSSRSA